MKTIEKLCSRFSRLHPGYAAFLDMIESCRGAYRVAISGGPCGLTSWYTFSSCRDFCEWMNGVILD